MNVKRIKWKCARHIARLKDDRWTKLITKWQPIDKMRKQGRQLTRWADRRFSGGGWKRLELSCQAKNGLEKLGGGLRS